MVTLDRRLGAAARELGVTVDEIITRQAPPAP
jgi:hypothetical protein